MKERNEFGKRERKLSRAERAEGERMDAEVQLLNKRIAYYIRHNITADLSTNPIEAYIQDPIENAIIFPILSPKEQSNQILYTILAVRDATSAEGAAIAQEILNQQLRDTTLDELRLSGKDIGPVGATALAKALENNNTLKTLSLFDNAIGDVGATALAKALENNHTLKTLYLIINAIGDVGATALANALEKNDTLKHLNLSVNRIGPDGATALATALANNHSLDRLNVGANSIGPVGTTALAAALEKNHTLKALELAKNAIGPVGATALAKALEKNDTLQELCIDSNNIGPIGATALAKALEKNHTLKFLLLCHSEIGPVGATALATALFQKNHTLELLNGLDFCLSDDLNAAVSQKGSLNRSINREATPMRRAGTYATCMIANRRANETLGQEKPDNAAWIGDLSTEIFVKIAREVHRDKGAWVNAVVEKRAEAKQHGMDITL